MWIGCPNYKIMMNIQRHLLLTHSQKNNFSHLLIPTKVSSFLYFHPQINFLIIMTATMMRLIKFFSPASNKIPCDAMKRMLIYGELKKLLRKINFLKKSHHHYYAENWAFNCSLLFLRFFFNLFLSFYFILSFIFAIQLNTLHFNYWINL